MEGAIVVAVAALDASAPVCGLHKFYVVLKPIFSLRDRKEDRITCCLPSAFATLGITRATSTAAGIVLSSAILGVESVEFFRANATSH